MLNSKHFAIGCILCAILLPVAGYSVWRGTTVAPPVVPADERHLDLLVSEVAADGYVPVVFRLTNRLNRPLQILGIDKSCNCFEASATQAVVDPGVECPINVRVAVSPLDRVKEISCIVRTDASQSPAIRYSARVEYVPPAKFDNVHISMGKIRIGDSKQLLTYLSVTAPATSHHHVADIWSSATQLQGDCAILGNLA